MLGSDHGDGRQHRAGAGDEDQPQAEAEDESAALGALPAAHQSGERALQPLPHLRHDQTQSDQPQDDQADPPQQVLGQAEGTEQPRADQGDHGEAEDQAGHHGQGPAAATQLGPVIVRDARRTNGAHRSRRCRGGQATPDHPLGRAPPPDERAGLGANGALDGEGLDLDGHGLVQTAGRSGGEDDREHREDARGDAGDQASEEPDEDQDDHRISLPWVQTGTASPATGPGSRVHRRRGDPRRCSPSPRRGALRRRPGGSDRS